MLGTHIYLSKEIRQELIYILQRRYASNSYIFCKEDMSGTHIYLTKKICQELIYILQRRYAKNS